MFGNHNYDDAVKIAEQKTRETGEHHIVMEVEESPGLYTIGVPVKAYSGEEFIAMLKGKINEHR